jgi:hypothetical protein
MKQKAAKDPNIKITSAETNTIKEQIKTEDSLTQANHNSSLVPKAGYYPQTECNPDNGAFFEERSNPLSSKGN